MSSPSWAWALVFPHAAARRIRPRPRPPRPSSSRPHCRPGNEVPPVTNADAGASGTATITFNLTRDAAGAILSGTVDFSVSLTGFPSGSALYRRSISTRAWRGC